jgi:hypothetical protein
MSKSDGWRRSPPEPLPEGIGQDPAVTQVVALVRGLDAEPHREVHPRAAVRGGRDPHVTDPGVVDALDGEDLSAAETERAAESPARNCSGRMPMPTRFERWMRS